MHKIKIKKGLYMTSKSGEIGPSSVPAPRPSEKKPFTIKKGLKKTEETLKLTSKIRSVTGSFVSLINEFQKISVGMSKGMKVGKGAIGIALTPFNVYYAVQDIQKIIMKPGIKDKARACFMLLTRLDSVIDSIASTCGILYAFKVVGQKTIDWIPIFNIVSFFVGFISIATAAEGVYDSGKLTYKLRNILKKLEDEDKDKKLSDCEKAQILGDFLKEVEEGGLTALRKKLMISKKAEFKGRRFEEAITNLSTKLLFHGPILENQEKAVEAARKESIDHATELLKKLAPRVKLELGLSSFDLANKVAATVGKGLTTFAPTPPTLIAGYAILATTGTLSLLMMGGKFLFISKNPFDPNSKNNAQLLVAKVAGGISHLRGRLSTLVLARGIFSSPSLATP